MSGAWVLLLSHQAWCPPLRPQTPASRAEAQPRAMELDVAAGERGPSRILPIVETLLRAKPFPATCPYDEATDAAFAQRQTPWVLAPPPAAEVSVLSRCYAARLAEAGASAVLEVTGDGEGTRLPAPPIGRPRLKRSWLHAFAGSYEAGRGGRGGGGRGGDAPQHALFSGADPLPYADASFDAVLCHGCLPYVSHPVALLGELFRVLKPSGVALLSFAGDPPVDRASDFDRRHATQV